MSELQRIGAIADRQERIEQLRTYAHAHEHDPDGWYMLHLELAHAGEHGASEVALGRAMALDRTVATRFKDQPAPPGQPQAGLEVPGYRVVRELHASAAARLYESTGPDGERCILRLLLGGSAASIARIMEHQQLTTTYSGCIAISKTVESRGGIPVQVLPWSDELPIDAQWGRLLAPEAARRAIASIAQILAAPHRDGLIAGDLRPSTLFGKLDQPDSLRVLGVRRAIDGGFGTLAGDDDRFRWYATEEGAELLDRRTDIYGLGLLLWWTAVGREPPRLDERLKDRMPDTGDADLDRIIAKCTQVHPADRHANVDELIRDLIALDAPHAGRWLLGDRIGGGTTADVYKATHATDKREAFVKVFTRRRNYERERAALAAAAAVPGITRELDASAPDVEHPYIALAPARGESLAQQLARGPLAPATATAIVRQLAAALAALHEAGVIHRDLGPADIFVAVDQPPGVPEVMVIDLDAAKLRAHPELDEPYLIGTPAYMAPEQWELVPDTDERADIYALGLVFFESITGHHPLTGDALIAWQRAHLDAARPAIHHPELPPHHAALIEAMISRDRARRPATMRDVIAVLDTPAPARPPLPPARRRDRRAWFAAGGGLFIVVVSSLLLLAGTDPVAVAAVAAVGAAAVIGVRRVTST